MTHGRVAVKLKCKFSWCKFRGTPRKDYLRKHLQEKHGVTGEPLDKTISVCQEQAMQEINPIEDNKRDFELLEAGREGNQEKMREILSQGTDPSISRGRTELHLAAQAGYESLVKLLIDNGADIRVRSSKGETAFLIAIKAGHQSIAKLLLEEGQDVHERYKHGRGCSALYMAVMQKRLDLVRTLLDYGGVDEPVWGSSTALIAAIETGQEDIVALLLRSGYNANGFRIWTLGLDGIKTPVHAATKAGPSMTKLILERKPDLEVIGPRFMTPLVTAVFEGDYLNNKQVVKLLLDAGATISPGEWAQLSPERQRHYADLFPLPIPPLLVEPSFPKARKPAGPQSIT